MTNVIAIISMLHEPAERHSADRLFRNAPVLDWTLRRLGATESLESTTILCWDDQLSLVNRVAAIRQVGVISKGHRQTTATMNAITTARRWSDGWRSGLLGTCEFDLGFAPLWTQEMMQLHDADAVLLVDPASALLDPDLVESLIAYSETQPTAELCFMQAAPGLAGTLLRRELVDRLTIANMHPGRLLTYFPDHHGVDPIGKPGCAPVPTPVARSVHRFKLDSDRQIDRAERSTAHLNGHLFSTGAERLVINMRGIEETDRLPREVVLEINTRRNSRPIFSPGAHLEIHRPEMTVAVAEQLFSELALMNDMRLTLSGAGDPLLSPVFFDIIYAAKQAGIGAINIETDLIGIAPEVLHRLARSGIDVVSVHFPAATAPTYASIMKIDGFSAALTNVNTLEAEIKSIGQGNPLIAMILVKMQANLGEMEGWYDYWLRRFGHAVIVGPSDYAGQIPDLAVADMSPQNRRPCERLSSRLTILSDGRVVSCEQDVLGKQTMGIIGETPIQEIWQQRFRQLRSCHQKSQWNDKPLCGGCREWSR